jgi:hypothetical protein
VLNIINYYGNVNQSQNVMLPRGNMTKVHNLHVKKYNAMSCYIQLIYCNRKSKEGIFHKTKQKITNDSYGIEESNLCELLVETI